jgi:rubrerythrin
MWGPEVIKATQIRTEIGPMPDPGKLPEKPEKASTKIVWTCDNCGSANDEEEHPDVCGNCNTPAPTADDAPPF